MAEPNNIIPGDIPILPINLHQESLIDDPSLQLLAPIDTLQMPQPPSSLPPTSNDILKPDVQADNAPKGKMDQFLQNKTHIPEDIHITMPNDSKK